MGSAVIDVASGTDIVPAVFTLTGPFVPGERFTLTSMNDMWTEVNTTEQNLASGGTAEATAIEIAGFFNGQSYLLYTAVGATVEVLAEQGATTVDISNIGVLPPIVTVPPPEAADLQDSAKIHTINMVNAKEAKNACIEACG